MEALQAALASLVALEARAVELVSPVEAIAEAVKAVVKEAAIVVEHLHGRVTELEQLEARVAALEARTAVTPASDVKPLDVSELSSDHVAAAPVKTDPLAGAPDVAGVFGFDNPPAETPAP